MTTKDTCPVCVLTARVKKLEEYVKVLKAALPPSDRLNLLADWVDLRTSESPETEVQDDLRRWAIEIEAVQAEGSG